MTGKEELIKQKTLEILKTNNQGVTIEDLSKSIGANRQTVTKYVLEMKGAGIITRRRAGSATLHYLNLRNGKL